MELKKQQEGNKLIVSVSGRLDTNAAPIMMKELEELLVDPVKEVCVKFLWGQKNK